MGGDRYAAPVVLRGWKETAGRGGDGTLLHLDLGGGTPDEPGDAAIAAGGSAELGIAVDGTVRLRAAGSGGRAPYPEDVVARGAWRPVAAKAQTRGGGRLVLTSHDAQVSIEIEASPFTLRVRDRRREVICTATELAFSARGAARIGIELTPGDHCFGLGGDDGPLAKRGRRVPVSAPLPWQQERTQPRSASVPYCLLQREGDGAPGCYGVFLDTFADACFDVAASTADRLYLECESALDLMLIPGPTPQDVTRRFTERVGRTPLPPLWALGHHLSHPAYRSEREVRGLARELLDRDIPADAIHLDGSHLDEGRSFSWDLRRFPDPQGLIHSLGSHGLHLVSLCRPDVEVAHDSPLFASGSAHDIFCRRADGKLFSFRQSAGDRALPDFNRRDARHWWGRLHAPLVEAGVSGIWSGVHEPRGLRARMTGLGRGEPDPGFRQAADDDSGRVVGFAEVRHLYEHQRCRASREALESLVCEQRPFVLTGRAGTGTQRYAALATTGNQSRWQDLGALLPTLLGLGVSGTPFCGSEIGGSLGSATPELYARWMQLGALSPLALTRGAGRARRREPWRFGRRVASIAREALRLRMRLLPYFYALMRHSESCGAPIWRSLAYQFPLDPEAVGIEDQLMIGPALLAAPVTEQGAVERQVYLPEGEWIDWHDGARYAGARWLQLATPLERLPLFARGGSVIPTRSPVRNTLEKAAEPLVLEVFPGGDASLELVEDDGETVAYRGDVVARTFLRLWSRAGGRLRLELSRREGPYGIALRPLRICLNACPTPNAVYLDGAPLEQGEAVPGWLHDPQGRLQVRLHDDGAGCALEVDPAP